MIPARALQILVLHKQHQLNITDSTFCKILVHNNTKLRPQTNVMCRQCAKFRAFSNGILIRFNSFFSDFLGSTSICRPLTIEAPCHTPQARHFGLIPTFNGTPSTSGKEHPVNSGGYYPAPDASKEKSSDTSAAQYTPSRTASEKGKRL